MSVVNLSKYKNYFRLEGNSDQNVAVNLFVTDELIPRMDCQKRLLEISKHPSISENVVVLPDIFCKNKNFIPGGVSLAVKNAVIPKFCGTSNDSMMLFEIEINGKDITSEMLDKVFEKISLSVGVYRRPEQIISKDYFWKLLTSDENEFHSEWDKIENIDLIREEKVSISQKDILDAFPKGRPEKLPDFIPWYDIETAGTHTLGVLDGNSHFIEICILDSIISENVSNHFQINKEKIYIAIHAGSADVGLIGHKQFLNDSGDIETFCEGTEDFEKFWIANWAGIRFAYANRFFIASKITEAFSEVVGKDIKSKIISDAPHDFVNKISIDNNEMVLHRKGAVEALPADQFSTDHFYGKYGKPFFFPTAPGNDSFIMINQKGNKEALYTSSHGAGRVMGMEEANQSFDQKELLEYVKSRNVKLYSFGKGKLASQAPSAFKSSEKILRVLENLKLADPVCRLKPLAVIKT